MNQTRCCNDVALHNHGDEAYLDGTPFKYRHTFEWRRPTLTLYRAADRRPIAAMLNRYPGVVIGAAIQVGGRVLSLTWGRPGRVIREAPSPS